jgi:hypothetical protein
VTAALATAMEAGSLAALLPRRVAPGGGGGQRVHGGPGGDSGGSVDEAAIGRLERSWASHVVARRGQRIAGGERSWADLRHAFATHVQVTSYSSLDLNTKESSLLGKRLVHCLSLKDFLSM